MINTSHDLVLTLKEYILTKLRLLKYFLLYVLPQVGILSKTKKFRGTKKSKKCFVFANGPSLATLDLNKVKKYQSQGFDVICVNRYISTEMAQVVKPDFYCITDPAYFGILGPQETPEEVRLMAKDADRLNDIGIPIFVPIQFWNRTPFVNSLGMVDFEDLFSRNIDILRPRGYNSMSAYKAIACACFLGYEKIYICGIDNDYFKTIEVDEDNALYFVDRHYDDLSGKRRKAGPQQGSGLGNLLWDYHVVFKKLELFKDYPIVNLSKNGLVDAFSKHHTLDVYK